MWHFVNRSVKIDDRCFPGNEYGKALRQLPGTLLVQRIYYQA